MEIGPIRAGTRFGNKILNDFPLTVFWIPGRRKLVKSSLSPTKVWVPVEATRTSSTHSSTLDTSCVLFSLGQ